KPLPAEGGEAIEKIRECLRDASGIFDLQAAELQTRHRKTHRDSMIVVSLDDCRTHRGRRNLESVIVLDDRGAQPPQFGRERADAIALVMADERDVADFG